MAHQPFIDRKGFVEYPSLEGSGFLHWTHEGRAPALELGAVWRWLTEPSAAVRGSEQRRKARFLALLLLVLLPLGAMSIAAQALTFQDFTYVLPLALAGMVVHGVAYGLSRTRYYGAGAIVTASLPSVVAFGVQIVLPENRFAFAFTAVSVLLGSILLSNRGLLVLAAANMGGTLLLPAFIPSWSLSSIAARQSFVIIVTVLTTVFVRYRELLERERRAELATSEERHRTLFDRVPVGLYRVTPQGEIADVNPALVEMLGYPDRESLQAVNARRLFVDRDACRRWQAMLKGAGVVRGFEMQLRRQAGAVIWVRDNTRAVCDASGRVCHYEGSLEDVTERKRAQEAETAQRELAETLRDLTLMLTAQMDLRAVLAELVLQARRLVPYTSANIALLEGEYLRIAHVEGYPRSISRRLATPERRWDALPLDRQAIESRQPVVVPDTAQHPAWETLGRTSWRSYVALPIILGDQVLGLLRLNGERPDQFCSQDLQRLAPLANAAAIALGNAQLYEAARERAVQLELVAHTGRQTTAILDLDELLQRTVNLITDTFGYYSTHVALVEGEFAVLKAASLPALKPLVGNLRNRIGVEGVVGWVAKTAEPLLVPDVRRDARYYFVDRAGEARSELAVPIMLKGKVVGVLDVQSTAPNALSHKDAYTLQPIADQLAIAIENARLFAQEERRAAELACALEQQQELERLRTEFIQNVSHELRTPLAIARGYAELLESGALGELQPQQREPVATIAGRTRTLSKMMEDISAILDIETQQWKPKPVDMAGLVQSLLSDCRCAAEGRELALAVQIAPNLPPVLGSSTHLGRVVENLVGNAVKFTSAGGAVTLRLRAEGDELALEVADTGVGIPEDQLDKVFERFYQVDGSTTRRYGGTGLGLALVKQVVEAHGGRVSVRSKVGEGSVFRVVLPAKRSESGPYPS